MVTQITGFFVHLSPFLHHLIHMHIINCVRIHHIHEWYCKAVLQPGGPAIR